MLCATSSWYYYIHFISRLLSWGWRLWSADQPVLQARPPGGGGQQQLHQPLEDPSSLISTRQIFGMPKIKSCSINVWVAFNRSFVCVCYIFQLSGFKKSHLVSIVSQPFMPMQNAHYYVYTDSTAHKVLWNIFMEENIYTKFAPFVYGFLNLHSSLCTLYIT